MNYQRSTFEEHELRKKLFVAEACINEYHFFKTHHHQLQQVHEDYDRVLRKRLVAEVYGRDHRDKHVIRYPENWLEAVKERFAPSFIRDLWPVRYTTVTASLDEIHPDIPTIPGHNQVLRIAVKNTTETPVW